MAKTKDQTAAEAETSIENAAPEAAAETSIENAPPGTRNQETDGPEGENQRSADQSLDGQNPPDGEDATGADNLTAPGPDIAPIEGEPPVTIRRLRAVIAEIEARNTELHRDGLLHELVKDHAASYDAEAGTLTIDGITATPATKRPAQILATWCSKARRAILSGAIPE